ncbi:MAG: DnaJ C-terminal domain-containing protein [Desulforhopalus sp.]
MEYKDYYKILGVTKDASEDDIQRAYRKLARKYHPDVCKDADADAKFKEISEAKAVLKDPEKRKLYDTYGTDWERAGQQPPPGWDHQSAGGHTQGGFHRTYSSSGGGFDGAEDFSDFFNNLFGGGFAQDSSGGRRRSYDAAGRSHEAEISVSLSEVFHTTTRTISFQVFEAGADGQLHPKEKTLQVKIPKGVTNGSVIRLAGQGEKGVGQGPAGDLLLRIAIAPDPRFRIEGYDLHSTVAVSPWEAALGAKIPVATVDGTVNLTIPPGSQSGRRFRLKGKGLPKKDTGGGDIFIDIEIRLPEALSEEEKRLFQELSEASRFDPREARNQRAKNYEKI